MFDDYVEIDGRTYYVLYHIEGRTVRPTLYDPGEGPEVIIESVTDEDGQRVDVDIPAEVIDKLMDYGKERSRERD